MKVRKVKSIFFLIGFGFLLPCFCQHAFTASNADNQPPKGFVSIFNGKDFTGWNIEPDLGAWYIKDGVIHCKGTPKSPYVIESDKKYENFELYVDFNISENGNSGILLQAPYCGRESRVGYELQIFDSFGQPCDNQICGAIYGVVAPIVNAVNRHDEWNTYHIKFDWPTCEVWLNDKKVQDINCQEHPELRYRLRDGYIGLQNHASKVAFRNIYIKELPGKEKWTSLFNGKDLSGWKTVGKATWKVKDGVLVASGDDGYLVSENEYEHFEFQVYAERGPQKSGGGIFYRWKSPDEPGYKAEFFNYQDAVTYCDPYFKDPTKNLPSFMLPPFTQSFLLTQIISWNRESIVRLNGIDVQRNLNHVQIHPGHIVIFHKKGDGETHYRELRIKKITNFDM